MASRKPLQYKETYLPASQNEREEAAAKLSALQKSKSSCGNCAYRDNLTCLLKDKRIAHYNICIHHKEI